MRPRSLQKDDTGHTILSLKLFSGFLNRYRFDAFSYPDYISNTKRTRVRMDRNVTPCSMLNDSNDTHTKEANRKKGSPTKQKKPIYITKTRPTYPHNTGYQ